MSKKQQELYFRPGNRADSISHLGSEGTYGNPHDPSIWLSARTVAALLWYLGNAEAIAKHDIDLQEQLKAARQATPDELRAEVERLRAELAAAKPSE